MELLPGHKAAPLQCVLRSISLNNRTQYEALSYTWGEPLGVPYRVATAATSTMAMIKNRRTSKLPVSKSDNESLFSGSASPASVNSMPEPFEVLHEMATMENRRAGKLPVSISGNANPVSSSGYSGSSAYSVCSTPDLCGDSEESEDELPISFEVLATDRQHGPQEGPRPNRRGASKYPEKIEDTHASSLDGYLTVGSHKIPLGRNLEQALWSLRLSDQARILWVDAICIDQSNNVEREHQVSQMGRIYGSATTVTIWLGVASENSDDALQFVRDLWQLESSRIARQDGTQSDWIAFKANFAPYGHFASERFTQLRALSYLVNRNWFHRRWVVQEVAFAKDIVVQCGQSTVSWPEFANTIAFLHKHHLKLVYILRMFHIHEDEYDWTSEPSRTARNTSYSTPEIQAHAASQFLFVADFLLRKDAVNRVLSYLVDIGTLVTKLWALQVSDPRDTMFALISLARDTPGSSDLYPNYSKSPCEVFVGFIEHVIMTINSMDIILRPWAPSGISLPSWISVLDTSSRGGFLFQDDSINEIKHGDGTSRNLYTASGQAHPTFRTYREGSTYTLETKGFIIESVVVALEVANQGNIPISWRQYAEPNQYSGLFVGDRSPTGDSPPSSYGSICEAFFRGWTVSHRLGELDLGVNTVDMEVDTVNVGVDIVDVGVDTADVGVDTVDVGVDTVDVNQLINVYHGSSRDERTLPKRYLAGFPQTEDTIRFLERLRVCTWNRRLIKTSGGNLGLAPAKMRSGDIICIIMGCSLPVILRPSGGNFIVVGAVYISGISDGNAMNGLQDGEYTA